MLDLGKVGMARIEDKVRFEPIDGDAGHAQNGGARFSHPRIAKGLRIGQLNPGPGFNGNAVRDVNAGEDPGWDFAASGMDQRFERGEACVFRSVDHAGSPGVPAAGVLKRAVCVEDAKGGAVHPENFH